MSMGSLGDRDWNEESHFVTKTRDVRNLGGKIWFLLRGGDFCLRNENVMAKSQQFLLSVAGLVLGVSNVQAGTIDPGQADWYKKYKKQQNAPAPENMLLNEDKEPELKSGFVDLFNGTDLSGWTTKGGDAKFEVKGGMIVGTAVPNTPSTYLCTEKDDYKDFVFTCEMKWEKDLNSGVMFRAKVRAKGGNDEVYGPQAEMEGVKNDRGWSGGVYGQSCGGYFYPVWLKEHAKARVAIKKEGWNRITIESKGKVVKTWLNGVPVSHWVGDGTYDKGFFGLQVHKAKTGEVLFKSLRVKELK